jgi:hypothetical protein
MPAADPVDVVDDVVGELGLDVLVLDQAGDFSLQFTDAGDADGGNDDQQEQGDGEADAEADADLEIGKHGKTSLRVDRRTVERCCLGGVGVGSGRSVPGTGQFEQMPVGAMAFHVCLPSGDRRRRARRQTLAFASTGAFDQSRHVDDQRDVASAEDGRTADAA